MGNTVLHTPLCDLLGIEYPVILAGMGPVAGGVMGPVATRQLAAAVSNAGGLGVIGGVAYGPDELRAEIRALREATDKPFGVDLLFSENFQQPVRGDERMPGRELVPARDSRRAPAHRGEPRHRVEGGSQRAAPPLGAGRARATSARRWKWCSTRRCRCWPPASAARDRGFAISTPTEPR